MASSWCLLPLKNCRFSLCFIRNLKIDYMYFFYFLIFIFSKFSKSKKDLMRIWKPIDFRLLWYHFPLISLKLSFRFNSFVWFYLKLGYKDVIETYFDCDKTFIWNFFFSFFMKFILFFERYSFFTIGTKTQVSIFNIHKIKYSLTKRNGGLQCCYLVFLLLKFFGKFCIAIYIYRYGEWNFLMHIKIIFVMDARVNVNIDVFVLNFFWTDL